MNQDNITRISRNNEIKAQFAVIELTHIPTDIEYRKEEKVFFSNIVLEYFRTYQIKLEMICTSCGVKEQLLKGMPHFYLLIHFNEATSDDQNLNETILTSFLCALHRMGYWGSAKKVNGNDIIPPNLFLKKVSLIYNDSGRKVAHHLLESDMTFIYNNLITQMASDIPDSLFSILLYGDGPNSVKCSIRILSEQEELGKLIYLHLIQGMKSQCGCNVETVKIEALGDIICRNYKTNCASTISYEQLSDLLQLPFGVYCSIPLTPIQRKLPAFKSGIIDGNDVCLGTIVGYENKKMTLPLQNEVTHMSVLGISGSGKSNFLLYYLEKMYNDYKIPFMVIDPVSTEYRKLKGNLNNNSLNVFTPGSDVSPFEFNLFALCGENLTIKEYKYILKDYLRNCLNLFAPLDKLIDETIDTVFLDKGWFDISRKNYLPGKTFTLSDIVKTFDQVFSKSEFTGNLKNIASSGKVRLNALLNYFNTVATCPLEEILTSPTVVELGKLQSAEAKSTLLLYMLNMVKLYMMDSAANRDKENNKQPRLILVIDEAHSILEMQEQGAGMNVAQQGVIDTINQLLLEYRKYGLVVVVADQRVSVLQDVLTNTHMQVIFKQIDPAGKQIAADIISLNEVQMLADQKIGEAFVKHPLLDVPVQVMTPRYIEKNIVSISDDAVKQYMEKEFWNEHSHIEISMPFNECRINCPFKGKKCCNRFYRSIACDLVKTYLKKHPSCQELRDAALKAESPIPQTLLSKAKMEHDMGLLKCLRVHLLHQSKQ